MFRDKNKWRVTWRENGKRCSMSFASPNDARLFEAQLKSGVSSLPVLSQVEMTFSEYAVRWHRDYAQIEKSETTWSDDLATIRDHLNPAIGHMRLIDIRKAHGLLLKVELSKKPIKAQTVNNHINLAKKMLSVAVDFELLAANPFQSVKSIKTSKPGFKFWTSEESEKFLKRCRELDPELCDLILFAVRTGLRLGEIKALCRKDLDFENRIIRVGATWAWKLGKVMDRSKNGEVDFVPMTPQIYDLLLTKKMMKPGQSVFRQNLVPYGNERLKLMCGKAMVQVLNFHSLRHTFASQLAMAGVDLFRIQKLMRHKSIEMTQRYAHLHPDSIKGASDLLDGDSQMTRKVLKFESAKSVSL